MHTLQKMDEASMIGRKSDVLDWARYGWPATIWAAASLVVLIWWILK